MTGGTTSEKHTKVSVIDWMNIGKKIGLQREYRDRDTN